MNYPDQFDLDKIERIENNPLILKFLCNNQEILNITFYIVTLDKETAKFIETEVTDFNLLFTEHAKLIVDEKLF